MHNRRTTAILLAAALALSLGGISVFAGEPMKAEATDVLTAPEAQSATSAQETTGDQESPISQDIPKVPLAETPATGNGAEQSQEETSTTSLTPADAVSFDNLEGLVSQGSLQYLILEEKVAWAQAVDYDKLGEDLKKGLNSLAEAQWQMHTGASNIQTGNPVLDGALQGVVSLSTSPAAQSLQAQYDTMREKFDDLKSGKLQSDAADGVRQLRDAQSSILMVTQGMYIQLSELQATQKSLDRSLAALDRQIQELELRYQLGQISAFQLQQAKVGRDTLVSKQESLDMSTRTLTMNLAAMLGADLTGELKLTGLPQVSAQELAAMDLEADLAASKAASFELYNAKKTLEDARKTYKDTADEYNYNEKKYQFIQAKHDLQGAEYTYDSVLQSYELKFRTLYEQVKDYAQVLTAARTSLAAEESACAVDRLKYEQGTISKNALLTAEDDLTAAKEAVNTAARNLFSSYNNYRWAVDHGILN